MDWKTFIAALIDSLAWPIVAVIVVFSLKDKVGDLLPRLRKFRHKETEVEFSELEELVREKEELKELGEIENAAQEDEEFSFLLKLAEVSPSSAIIESYKILELAVEKAVLKKFPNINPRDLIHPLTAKKMLLKGDLLSQDQYEQLRILRNLKNTAAHSQDLNLANMPIEAYIDIALTLANQLNE